MARRWTADDLAKLKSMAKRMPAEKIAEKLHRPVGGTVFKAHQLGLSLRAGAVRENPSPLDPGPAGQGDQVVVALNTSA